MKTAATISGEIIRGSVSSGLSCVEFPNMETAHEFYHSEDYEPLSEVRLAATESKAVLVEAV